MKESNLKFKSHKDIYKQSLALNKSLKWKNLENLKLVVITHFYTSHRKKQWWHA